MGIDVKYFPFNPGKCLGPVEYQIGRKLNHFLYRCGIKRGKLTIYDTGLYRNLESHGIGYFELVDGEFSLVRLISNSGEIVCGRNYKGVEYCRVTNNSLLRRIRNGGLWGTIFAGT